MRCLVQSAHDAEERLEGIVLGVELHMELGLEAIGGEGKALELTELLHTLFADEHLDHVLRRRGVEDRLEVYEGEGVRPLELSIIPVLGEVFAYRL